MHLDEGDTQLVQFVLQAALVVGAGRICPLFQLLHPHPNGHLAKRRLSVPYPTRWQLNLPRKIQHALDRNLGTLANFRINMNFIPARF